MDYKKTLSYIQSSSIQESLSLLLDLQKQARFQWLVKRLVASPLKEEIILLITKVLGYEELCFLFGQYDQKLLKYDQFSSRKDLSFIIESIDSDQFFDFIDQSSFEELLKLHYQEYQPALKKQLKKQLHLCLKKKQSLVDRLLFHDQSIQLMNVKEVKKEDIQKIKTDTEEILILNIALTKVIDKLLSIAFYIEDSLVIEPLSDLKENLIKQKKIVIGSPSRKGVKAEGIYETLENRLAKVYKNRVMAEKTSAIDALGDLSILQLEDYQKIGLVPKSFRKKEQAAILAKKNLKKVGIKTLNDLKKLEIFSSSLLKEYLKRHKKLLVQQMYLSS